MTGKNQLKHQIDRTIAELCADIAREPMLHFSEADIQQMLVERLRQIKGLDTDVDTARRRAKDSKAVYKTRLVHREYGDGERGRIDVVVFDPEDAAKIDNANLQIGDDYLVPDFAVELGTEKTTNALTHIKNDLEKLERAKTAGYLIYIFRDTTKSPTGQKRRQQADKSVERRFKKVVLEEVVKKELPSNIRVLAVLLGSFRDQSKLQNQCQILDKGTGSFVAKSIDRARKKKAELIEFLMKQLAWEPSEASTMWCGSQTAGG